MELKYLIQALKEMQKKDGDVFISVNALIKLIEKAIMIKSNFKETPQTQIIK